MILSPETLLDFALGFCAPEMRQKMKRSRFTEEQIIRILKEHQAGLSAADMGRKHGISDGTF